MILDNIKYLSNYNGISKNLDNAINFLLNNDLAKMEVGKYDIDGDNVYYLIQEYNTKNRDNGKFEAHHNYIDIQYILDGQEFIGYAPIENLKPLNEYDEKKDKTNLVGEAEMHLIKKGMCAIYFPNDAHMPSVNDENIIVKKAVVKIRV